MKSIAISLFLVLTCSVVNAAEYCDQRARIVKSLTEGRYQEVSFAEGVAPPKTIYEIFVNKETGTFTLLRTTITATKEDGSIAGIACVVGGGIGWKEKEEAKPTRHTMLWWQLQ